MSDHQARRPGRHFRRNGAAYAARSVALAVVVSATGGVLGAQSPPAGAAESQQLICEGSFPVQDSTCWVMPPTPPPAPDGSYIRPGAAITNEWARNGAGYSAELCNFDNCSGSFYQEFAVPKVVRLATLKFWATSATSDWTCLDYLLAYVGSTLVRNFCSGALSGTGEWSQHSLDVTDLLRASRGDSHQVGFLAETDSVSSTQFVVDDVRLDVITARRAVTLSLTRHLVATGSVQDAARLSLCYAKVPVQIDKWRTDRWVTVRTTVTDALGDYRVSLPDRPGRFRAVAPTVATSETYGCPSDRSGTQTHAH